MYSLITFATQWGSKYGGINSFNEDFLTAFGIAYEKDVQVICLVAEASPAEIDAAGNSHVKLLALNGVRPNAPFDMGHALCGVKTLKDHDLQFSAEHTVWLGHDRITGAAAIEAARVAGGRSALIHHMSYDHYESYAENSASAHKKTSEQKELFKQADLAMAIGPLLRDALTDLLGADSSVPMLIPGLAQIDPRSREPKTFSAFLSGRLSDDAARIKQGHLGVAAFAEAYGAACDIGRPASLSRRPKLVLRGLDFEPRSFTQDADQEGPEGELSEFAERYAKRVINLHALPYTSNRKDLYSELCMAGVALMPSWHEGFGLVAWEAVAAGVPLIIGKNSGVFRLLEEEYPGAGPGCVYPIDVGGIVRHPFFHDTDLQSVVSALNIIADDQKTARKKAAVLCEMLSRYTWTACAENTAGIFGWELERGAALSILPAQSTPPPKPDPTVETSPLQIP